MIRISRRTAMLGTAAAGVAGLARPAIAQAATVRWWYHFDNPEASPAALISRFARAITGLAGDQ